MRSVHEKNQRPKKIVVLSFELFVASELITRKAVLRVAGPVHLQDRIGIPSSRLQIFTFAQFFNNSNFF